jgi:hypothetical protein
MTPLDALNALAELQRRAREQSPPSAAAEEDEEG